MPVKAKKKKAAPKAAKKKAAKKKPAAKKAAKPAKSGLGKGMSLVIVESPAKARTIEKYLGPDFKVMASVGHVIDLPVSSLGVDPDQNFAPQYEIIKGKKTIVDSLKREARKARHVYLAPDPDREGEAIAYHVAQAIGNGNREIHRVVFNEITPEAVRRGIENPVDIDINLFNAQQARRILDRLVGYKISPLLWKKVRRGLSAGRVQSVAMRVICDREREIRIFDPVEYWTIEAEGSVDKPPPVVLKLAKINGKTAEIPDKEASDKIIGEVKGKPFIIEEVKKRETAKRPFPPFITSTLQQEASRKLRMTARRTMRLAQRLYEGVELGSEGPQGLITYMRTDSTRLAGSALDSIRGFINDHYPPEYLPENARFYAKSKGAQDAHEAVRPTDIARTPERMKRFLNDDALALYTLIWNRTAACQMADAKLERTRVEIPVGDYLFVTTGSVLKFKGFLAIYEEAKDETGQTESDMEGAEKVTETGDNRLPPMEKGQEFDVKEVTGLQHFTQPPPHFTEASLIKELEKQGIGRPSTYAQIISTIQDREYAVREKGQFKPTDLGFIVTDLLIESFPQIMDIKFTAMMESQLDEVEGGKVNWVELLRNFYIPFAKRLEIANEQMRNLKAEVVPTEHVCEKCGSPMVVRWGRNGKFLACSSYPKCRNTKPIIVGEDGKVEIVKPEETDIECENCGKMMVVKSGRRGRFLACSGYPDCKTTRPLPIGVKCDRPGCEGELLERRSQRGRTFYSCSAYPECRFSVWERPQKVTCDLCNEERLVVGKAPKQKVFGCLREDCNYAPVYVEPKPEEGAETAENGAKATKSAARPKKAAKKKAVKKKKATKAKKAPARKAAKKSSAKK